MATSPLARTGEQPPETGRGHGTAALGPSDRSDTGSDVVGGPGLEVPGLGDDADARLGLDSGTTSDPATGGETSGPELGDANLDSDTDSTGTGERAEVGRESSVAVGHDIGPDRIVGASEAGVTDHDPAPWEDVTADGDRPVDAASDDEDVDDDAQEARDSTDDIVDDETSTLARRARDERPLRTPRGA